MSIPHSGRQDRDVSPFPAQPGHLYQLSFRQLVFPQNSCLICCLLNKKTPELPLQCALNNVGGRSVAHRWKMRMIGRPEQLTKPLPCHLVAFGKKRSNMTSYLINLLQKLIQAFQLQKILSPFTRKLFVHISVRSKHPDPLNLL